MRSYLYINFKSAWQFNTPSNLADRHARILHHRDTLSQGNESTPRLQ